MNTARTFLILAFIVPQIAYSDQFKVHSKTFPAGPFPTSIAAADLNGDDIPEIVTTSRGNLSDPSEEIPAGAHLTYLTADEPLAYKSIPQFNVGFGPYAVQIVNIDALKAKDLVVANFMAARDRDLTLLRNLGDNIFEPIHFSVPDNGLQYRQHRDGVDKPVFTVPGLTALVVDDFDGDGYRDAVATGWSSDIIVYFPGDIEKYFGPPVIFDVEGGPRDLVISDFDRDGKKDLAILAYRSGEIVIMKGDGKGIFKEVNRFVTRGRLPVTIALGDMNDDGKQDLVVGHSHATDSVVIFYQDKDFRFPIAQEIQLGDDQKKLEFGIRDLLLIDANQDSALDIALACSAAQQVIVLINTKEANSSIPSFTQERYTFEKGRPYALTSADFDADGKPDLGVALWDENRVGLLLHK